MTGLSLLLLLVVAVGLQLYWKEQQDTALQTKTATHIPEDYHQQHIIGGFNITTPEQAVKAAANGVQVVFRYGTPPSSNSALGQKLQALHMKVVDGYISSYLTYFECHRTLTIHPPPEGESPFCQQDSHPELNNEQAVLSAIEKHLQDEQHNSLIIGYWVLDDWAIWDTGSAQHLLGSIHALIQRYTPNRPAICGFGAALTTDQTTGWDDRLANNFSSQGCDMVGAYIYSPTLSALRQLGTNYDWSMKTVLPALFSSLQKRGWDIHHTPLLGIAQAFGGLQANIGRAWATISAQNIQIQSNSFCQHGAMGLVFYGWDDSKFGLSTPTPLNSPEIEAGIRQGITTCVHYWSTHP